ncbi:unnamed protein product [Dibothriocephalus latus]|uniref:Uncharacterized protein n=1 Tax=Dibothriocephalus latus TaxID=60516 RepID=A0A3P7P4B6_DIBLA|nr:unnamed protein product [Dibothriocephalus latus]
MAKSRRLIFDPVGLIELLRVAKRLLDRTDTYPTKNEETRLLWAASALLSRLAGVDYSDRTRMLFLIIQFEDDSEFLLEMAQALQNVTFSQTLAEMRNVTAMAGSGLLSAVGGFLENVFAHNATTASSSMKNCCSVLTQVEKNKFGLFKRPRRLSSWTDGGYLMPNFKIYYVEKGNFPLDIPSKWPKKAGEEEEAVIISFVRFEAVLPNITLDLLALPRIANWTAADHNQTGDGSLKPTGGLLPINSGIQRVSALTPRLTQNVEVHYEAAIPLIVQNEYKAVAFARINDAMHWKARETAAVGSSEMEFGVQCVHWKGAPDNHWDPSVCTQVTGSLTSVTCRCKQAGIFAVAMESPEFGGHPASYWWVAGAPSLRVFNLLKVCLNAGGNSLSFLALISLCVYLYKKETEPELVGQNKIKINFTLALAGYHLIFMFIPFLEQFRAGCLFSSLGLQLFGSAYLAWHMCQCFYLFGALINGTLANTIKLYIFIGWIVGPVIVFIDCVSSFDDYGLGRLCLPGPESASMFVYICQAAILLLLSIVCCFILLCNVDTPAYLKPLIVEALQ